MEGRQESGVHGDRGVAEEADQLLGRAREIAQTVREAGAQVLVNVGVDHHGDGIRGEVDNGVVTHPGQDTDVAQLHHRMRSHGAHEEVHRQRPQGEGSDAAVPQGQSPDAELLGSMVLHEALVHQPRQVRTLVRLPESHNDVETPGWRGER